MAHCCNTVPGPSFYGKAKVIEEDNGEKVLQSYNTKVCKITSSGEVIRMIPPTFSASIHIEEDQKIIYMAHCCNTVPGPHSNYFTATGDFANFGIIGL